MPLESLLAVVGKLRGRIGTHGDSLRQSEWLTRYALIDPLLRELGWDTGDLDVVIPEFSVDGAGEGRGGIVRGLVNRWRGDKAQAGYALMDASSGKPVILVDAKKLDEPLLDGNALQQGIQGCVNTATDFFAVTNGRKWEIYDTRKRVSPPEMKVVEFDLSNDSAAEVCLKALALWRHGAVAGNVRPAQTPIAGLMGEVSVGEAQSADDAVSAAEHAPVMAQPASAISVPQEPAAAMRPEASPIIQPSPSVASASVGNDGWRALSDVQAKRGDVKPTQLMFPDNSSVAINAWNQVVIQVVRWLTNNGRLDASHCPIQYASGYIVATQPIHPNGREFKLAREVNSLYIELNYDAPNTVRNANLIIERVRMDASQFFVKWGFHEFARDDDNTGSSGEFPKEASQSEFQSVPEQAPVATIPPSPLPIASTDEWQALPDVQPKSGDARPAQMMFPDNSSVAIHLWRDVEAEAVRWLTDNRHLDTSHCPIQRGAKYLVATEPIHPSGKEFEQAREVNSLHVELHYSASDLIRNARVIIERVGMNPSQFKLRWRTPEQAPAAVIPPSPLPAAQHTSPITLAPSGEWRALSEAASGHKPREIRFRDGTTATMRTWNGIIIEVVRWLANNNYLSADDCPIQRPGSTSRYVVHTNRVGPTGKPLYTAQEVSSLWVDTHGNRTDIVDRTLFVIGAVRHKDAVGLDPANFLGTLGGLMRLPVTTRN